MVLIEQEQEDERQQQQQQQEHGKEPSAKPPKTSSDSTANDNGDTSDGFETASERDVSDNEKESDSQNENHDKHEQEVQLDDAALKQKALNEVNEAKLEGNKLFGEAKYEEALSQYDVAIRTAESVSEASEELTELRSICHSNRAICFLKLGKFEDTIKECTRALELNPTYMKALLRRAEAHEKLEHFEEAIADMKKILELDPSNNQARKTIIRLEPLAAEKREKMKEEMIGKLKEMGNSILGRFGMSVDNFKAVKDPNTGSYSISFQR